MKSLAVKEENDILEADIISMLTEGKNVPLNNVYVNLEGYNLKEANLEGAYLQEDNLKRSLLHKLYLLFKSLSTGDRNI